MCATAIPPYVLDDTRDDELLVPLLSYFSNQAFRWDDDQGTYADPNSTLKHTATVEWVHSLSSILNGLIAAGLRIDRFDEFDSIEWQALDHLVETAPGRWSLPPNQQGFVPLVFAVEASKPTGSQIFKVIS